MNDQIDKTNEMPAANSRTDNRPEKLPNPVIDKTLSR